MSPTINKTSFNPFLLEETKGQVPFTTLYSSVPRIRAVEEKVSFAACRAATKATYPNKMPNDSAHYKEGNSRYALTENSVRQDPPFIALPSTAGSEAKFKKFPKLPLELREMIFTLALPGPRIITVGPKTGFRVHVDQEVREFYAAQDPKVYDRVHRVQLVTLLHASHEARDTALKYYEPALGNFFNGKPVYFDYKNDFLGFDGLSGKIHFHGLCAPTPPMAIHDWQFKVENVFLYDSFLAEEHGGIDDEGRVLWNMAGLKRAIIESSKERWDDECEDYFEFDCEDEELTYNIMQGWMKRIGTDDEDDPRLPRLEVMGLGPAFDCFYRFDGLLMSTDVDYDFEYEFIMSWLKQRSLTYSG